MCSGSSNAWRVRFALKLVSPRGNGTLTLRSSRQSRASRRNGLLETGSGPARDMPESYRAKVVPEVPGTPGGRWHRGTTFPRRYQVPLRLRVVLGLRLRLVLGLRVVGLGLADDLLARPVRVVRGRVRDDVDEVEQRHVVVAGATVDRVGLAVTGVDAVVAALAVDGVAGGVARAADVLLRERPQVVVAVAPVRGVHALVGEDPVVAVAAVLDVVTGATRHEVVAVV